MVKLPSYDQLIAQFKRINEARRRKKVRSEMKGKKITRRCFCCEKPILGGMNNKEKQYFNEPPSGATCWHTTGNFGSFFDPFDSSVQLEISICDDCLKEKAHLAHEFILGSREVKKIAKFKPCQD
jgi:hypothetical protein